MFILGAKRNVTVPLVVINKTHGTVLGECPIVVDNDGLVRSLMMEAQILNLPVIASNISAVPELIRNGVNGLLIAANDPESLATAIKELSDNQDKRIEMGVNGARIVREKFSCEPGIQRVAKKFRKSMAPE